MQERLKSLLLQKLAEDTSGEDSYTPKDSGDLADQYLAARKGKVPVDPPQKPDEEGKAPTYPVQEIKKESAIQILKNRLFKLAKDSCKKCGSDICKCASEVCPDCKKSDCMCDNAAYNKMDEMKKESALRRKAIDLIKSAMPQPPMGPEAGEGAMPLQAPPQTPPPPPAEPVPEAPPQPPMGAMAEQGGPSPEVVARLQQHLQEHLMMEEMGMHTPEESQEEEHGGMGTVGPAEMPGVGMPDYEEEEDVVDDNGEAPQEQQKKAAVQILKDLIYEGF